MSKGSICIIDDEPDMVETCSDILRAQGYDVATSSDGGEGLALIGTKRFDIVLVDLMMPKVDGMQILTAVKKADSGSLVIIFTGYPTIDSAVSAMKNGAFDYLVKPFMATQLISVIDRAIAVRQLQEENRDLKQKLASAVIDHPFIGTSPSIREVLNSIQKVAPLESNVLITGESGTGKELVAKTIHLNSKRKDKTFVPINCSALPEPLLESELFGHEKGAFSGAVKQSIGLFEFADKGSIFLDEIGELPLSLQAKLLRVLQEREIRRVGGKEQISIDVRIIASTNRDLEQFVKEGKFREDLYFRLNVIRLKVPPLRERLEDITLLARHFLDSFNSTHKSKIDISADAIALLKKYSWPGNVRELENAIHQGASMTDNMVIEPRDLPEALLKQPAAVSGRGISPATEHTFNDAKNDAMSQFEKDYLLSILQKAKGNVSNAAEMAGMHRSSFQRLIRKYHIVPAAIKGSLVVNGEDRGAWIDPPPHDARSTPST
jgi:DNA-binding NtrC family response regulator